MDNPRHLRNAITTSILLSNLHCPSCVRTIEDRISAFGPDVIDVSASTVSQTVTVRHSRSITAAALAKALHDVGFDVQSVQEQRGHNRALTYPLQWSPPIVDRQKDHGTISNTLAEFTCGLMQSPEQDRLHKAAHSAHCDACATEAQTSMEREDSGAKLTGPEADRPSFDEKQPVEPIPIVVDELPEHLEHKVVLSVQGMTCSSCVGRVQEALQALPFVQQASVNLINQSVTVHIIGDQHAPELVEEVEDIGYEAAIESCDPMHDRAKDNANQGASSIAEPTARNVIIRVEGVYCQHCPTKIMSALESFGDQLHIEKPPTHLDGLVEISYTPQPPGFTIRDVITRLDTADPLFKAQIYHPPTLEERAQKLQAQHRNEIALRLALAVLIAVPTFIIGIVFMSLLPGTDALRQYFMEPIWAGQVPRAQWALFILATPVYFLSAGLFHHRALKGLYLLWRPTSKVPILRRFYRFGSMDLLLSLGTTVAYFGSISVIILAATEGSSDSGDQVDTTTYFDAVVFLTMFLLMGRLLEAFGKEQTADAVSSLGKLRPSEALLLTTSTGTEDKDHTQQTTRIPVDQLESGDIVSILPGSSPPCDGVIVHGTSTFDESSLTGEAKPVTKTVDGEVFAGTVNVSDPVHVRITGFAGISLLDRIVDVVREGQARRAPIERVADLVTGYFVPAITFLAVADWLIWLALGHAGLLPYIQVGTGGWVFWSLQFAIAVLVVACPCGIGLAAPTALFVGTGLAAKNGILVKGGGEAFQEASGLDCVVFDKTGTITQGGNPKVTDHFYSLDTDKEKVLRAVRALESMSNHPLARAIVDFCDEQQTSGRVEVLETTETAGKGLVGEFTVDQSRVDVFIGNESLAQDHGIGFTAETTLHFQEWSKQGKTVVFVGVNNDSAVGDSTAGKMYDWSLALVLAISDPIRPEAPNTVKALESKGVAVWLLSGDNQTTAQAVAAQVGIQSDRVIAGVLPHQKAEKIQYLQKSLKKRRATSWSKRQQRETDQRATIAMVGDGINDAPALAMADVGIALGSGTDTAISSADFVLISSDLTSVLLLVQLSKAVLRRVKFNFGWAMGYNLIMLPIAAGVLFPAVNNGSHIRLDPVWASLAMALSSVSVVTSSLLLKSRLPLVGFRI